MTLPLPGFDPAKPDPAVAMETVRSLLADLGVPDEDIRRATADGTLPLLAVERLMEPSPAGFDLDDVTERTGLSSDQVLRLWRSLGFPEARAADTVFTEADVEILQRVGALLGAEVASEEVVFQMSRVIGSSIARIAQAQVDVISAGATGGESDDAVSDNDRVAMGAGTLLPIMPRVFEATWRRHLQAAARRRLLKVGAGDNQPTVVGFADLVGFTALSQQVSADELAAIVEQFEKLVFDVITAGGGRVVKMIGDEVMFGVDEPVAAAEIALALAEGTRAADELSDVRVGLAHGPVLERESDLYGPVVNLASRVTAIAFPGSVVVDAAMQENLRDRGGEGDFELRSMRPRYLKDIGRVPLWVLRRRGARRGPFSERRRALREAVRARVDPRPTVVRNRGS